MTLEVLLTLSFLSNYEKQNNELLFDKNIREEEAGRKEKYEKETRKLYRINKAKNWQVFTTTKKWSLFL